MSINPILFSTPMVQALLAGRKTMTRRVIKPQPHTSESAHDEKRPVAFWMDGERWVKPPRQPGDVLWVRETWQQFYPEEVTEHHQQGPRGFSGSPAEIAKGHYMHFYYRADGEIQDHPEYGKALWKPSIFMPLTAARIWLHVTGVKAERVQDITNEDAIKEGFGTAVDPKDYETNRTYRILADNLPRARFADLWNSLNADRGYGWDSNPWVWAISFERCEAPAGEDLPFVTTALGEVSDNG